MTKSVLMVQTGHHLSEAAQIFLQNGISAAPVVTPMGEIKGILSEVALMRALILFKVKDSGDGKIAHYLEMLDPIV
jgi:predicted transcriptional regulator